jgi:hypothetical protein
MPSDYETVRTIAQQLIRDARDANGGVLTTEMIEEHVDKVFILNYAWRENVSSEKLVTELATIFSTWIGVAKTLCNDDDHEPWFHQKRADISWRYWARYEQFLREMGWATNTVDKLEEMTNDTLGHLEDPERFGTWDRRGLVVGHVQSGKTANYIGLICKAIDAGYKLIIVLAGMHNNLRSQTQIRLEEGVLGYDRIRLLEGIAPEIGVGQIDPSVEPRIDTITTRMENGDFKRAVANNFGINLGGNPLLFIIKKNGSVLRNLLDWVEWASKNKTQDGRPFVSGVPLLVIDDEADLGSVDTKDHVINENGEPDYEHDPTVLNQRIRRLLYSFDQSAYVGYTATPFANIFIHEQGTTSEHGDDLFPRSFITCLPAPSNFIGPARVFGLDSDDDPENEKFEGLPVLRTVEDHAATLESNETEGWVPPKHFSNHVVRYDGNNAIPPSLREAMYAFVLVVAARMARGQVKIHNSMLIHITRFIKVQQQIFEQVYQELTSLQNRLIMGEGSAPNPIIEDLQRLWNEDFLPTTQIIGIPDCTPVPWEEIEKFLVKAASAIKVKQINGSAGDVLDYEEHKNSGLNVIAIGGDKLSRGLTLEGLSVSYFLRASKMYDTLMQMGRWFGYRPGYVDLCRLYTSDEIVSWFEHITNANEELRQEFDHMVSVGGTPRDYGLRVKSHSTLLVTSRVKMRHGKRIFLSFGGGISETIVFYRNTEIIARNHKAIVDLIERILADNCEVEESPNRVRLNGETRNWRNSRYWKGVSPDHIKRFLDEYVTHPAAYKVQCRLLKEYIEKQNNNNDLNEWDVFLLSGNGQPYDKFPSGPMNLVTRNWNPNIKERGSLPSDRFIIRRLLSSPDEAIDLEENEYAEALKKTREAWTADPGRSRRQTLPDVPNGPSIREVRRQSRGLLLLYPLDSTVISTASDQNTPLIGFGISFPGNPNDIQIEYVVDNVYYDQEFGVGE